MWTRSRRRAVSSMAVETTPETRALWTVLMIFMLGTLAKALRKKDALDWGEVAAEFIVAGLLAFGFWNLGAVLWATGLGTVRQLQWFIRLANALIKAGKSGC
jgi:hypothetical protein